jgi:putative aminopeptidase FrvX
MIETLKKLSRCFGPSGNEETVNEFIKKEISGIADDVWTDSLGNLIAVKKGRDQRIMLAAHMDEIGVIVTSIDENGYLRFSNIGGISPFTLIGQRAVFENGTIGVFGTEKLDNMKDLKIEKMFIDIGACDAKWAKSMVNIGDAATVSREPADCNKYVTGKALDDRAGCAVLIETMRRLKKTNNEVYFVFTVQEEVGLRGARTSAFAINPDFAIAVDVTATGDTPKARTMEVKLGQGVAIKVKDNSVLVPNRIKQRLTYLAQKHNIKYQLEVLEFGGTDSGAISITRDGIPSGVLSIPCRYLHTPVEMIDPNDMENAVKLLLSVLQEGF